MSLQQGSASSLPIRVASPAPLAEDFARQQVAKQQRSNFHSTSLTRSLSSMVTNNVNKTALHPTGVQYVASTCASADGENDRLEEYRDAHANANHPGLNESIRRSKKSSTRKPISIMIE